MRSDTASIPTKGIGDIDDTKMHYHQPSSTPNPNTTLSAVCSNINPGSLNSEIMKKVHYCDPFFFLLASHTFEITTSTLFLTLFYTNYWGYICIRFTHSLSFSVSLTIASCLPTKSPLQGIFISILGFCFDFCAISQIRCCHFIIPHLCVDVSYTIDTL